MGSVWSISFEMIKLAKTQFENVSGVHTSPRIDRKKSKCSPTKCSTGMRTEGSSQRRSSPITKTPHKSPMTCHPPLLWSLLLLSNQHKPKRADSVVLCPTPPTPSALGRCDLFCLFDMRLDGGHGGSLRLAAAVRPQHADVMHAPFPQATI